MKQSNNDWPEALGLPLETLQLHDLPGLEKVSTKTASSGKAYSYFSGPISHNLFERVILKTWENSTFPNHLQLTSPELSGMEHALYHLTGLFGEAELEQEEHYIWRHPNMYIIASLQEELQLNIYLNRNTECVTEQFRRLFTSTDNILPYDL